MNTPQPVAWSATAPHAGHAAALRRHLPALAALLALAALGAWLLPRALLGPGVALATVQQRDFAQTVVASGHVEAPHRISIGAQVTGTVRRVPVAEGQDVPAGQVLVELEDAEARAALAQADLGVVQAQARLRQVREVQSSVADQQVRQSEVNLRNARVQLQRSEDLQRQGFIGQVALDDARKAVDLAESQWRAAQVQAASAQPGGSDLALAESSLAQARAAAAAARSRLDYLTLKAPAAGTLIARDVEPGDVVQPGKALMVLSPSGATQLVVQIDEKNLHLLALGQPARASADAWPDQPFDARLAYVNPGIDAQRGSVEVKLLVPQPPAMLRQDMTVSVDIRVAARAQAVLVPAEAVQAIDSPQPWVLVFDDGRLHRRVLKLGLRGGGFCEVLSGLKPGERVLAGAPGTLHDGSRVRAP